LFRIHRAHVERVPYETTWIHLGEQWGIDVDSSIERVAFHGRGGYCFHLNGSLSRLLESLGYDVSHHVGGVHGPEPSAADLANHLVLVVGGLPTADNPAGDWYVDVGLGDALHEPLPLLAGTYCQGPMTFELEETPGGIGDWHFIHDPGGSFVGINFCSSATDLDAFEDRHRHLSTSPESGFVRTVTAQRRQQHGATALRALTFTTRDQNGTSTRIVAERDDWFALLADEFLLPLDGVGADARDRLWASARAAHDAWALRAEPGPAHGSGTRPTSPTRRIATSPTSSLMSHNVKNLLAPSVVSQQAMA
ncbi:MAG: arylamine N-acetyltransferase family protein, partial [Ilumatobacteraceae bacterium]